MSLLPLDIAIIVEPASAVVTRAERRSATVKRYYESHKKQHYAGVRRTQAARLLFINKMKQSPCVDCGQSYPPYVMDFDHVRGEKKFNIAANRHAALDKLMAEVVKCDLVCANCHRERTHKRSGDGR